MATTTNYSWTTPDDTDLVKDGAAAIRTLGSAADATVKNLNPGTTAGDIDYYTSGTAKARIAIGTAGQILRVNSGATAPEWATPSGAGLVFINKTDFTTSSAVNINDVFSTTYDNYRVMIVAKSTTGTKGQVTIRMRVSGSDTSTSYTGQRAYFLDTTVAATRNEKGTDEGYVGDIGTNDDTSATSLDFYSPYLAKATTCLGQNFSSQDTFLVYSAFTQSDSTSFTGFSALFTQSSTGSIFTYGYAKV